MKISDKISSKLVSCIKKLYEVRNMRNMPDLRNQIRKLVAFFCAIDKTEFEKKHSQESFETLVKHVEIFRRRIKCATGLNCNKWFLLINIISDSDYILDTVR